MISWSLGSCEKRRLRGESGRAGVAAADRSPRLSPPSKAVRWTREALERQALSRYTSRERPGDDDVVTGLERVRDSLSDVGTAFDCPALTPDDIPYRHPEFDARQAFCGRPPDCGDIAFDAQAGADFAPAARRLVGSSGKAIPEIDLEPPIERISIQLQPCLEGVAAVVRGLS